jgi:Uncharacterized protein conserved in bacteria
VSKLKTNPKVDAFVKKEKKWPTEVAALRKILLASPLEEDLKWGFPCYTMNDTNLVMIQSFKGFCALMFFKGFALKDPKGLLKAPGENSNVVSRFEFTKAAEITKAKAAINNFIKQSIKAEDTGVKLEKKTTKQPTMPAEFKTVLAKNKKLKTAFDGLTPGRQRLYLMHFSAAKQAATRVSRIEKCTPKILKGLGLND